MKKRLLAVLLCVIIVMALLPATAFAAPVEFIEYTTADTVPVTVKLFMLHEPVGDTPDTVQVGDGSGTAISGGGGSITSVTLPDVVTDPDSGNSYKVTAVGARAFADRTDIKSVNLAGVTTIGNNAFDSCSDLETVNLPKVQTIGSDAFFGCTALKSVTIWQTSAPILENFSVFQSMTTSCTLYVPNGAASEYIKDNGWQSFRI